MTQRWKRAARTVFGRALGPILLLGLSGCTQPVPDDGPNSETPMSMGPLAGTPGAPVAGGAATPPSPGQGGAAAAGTSGGSDVVAAPGAAGAPMAGAAPEAGAGGAGVATAGAGAGAGAGSAGSASDPPAAGPPPQCIANPSQVVIVGDSYINWGTHTLPADLAAESGEIWRLYAIGGASLASGGATGFIPDQLELAIAEDPNIRVVVMDGGGNDILIPNALFLGATECKNDPNAGQVEVCKMIVDLALEKSREMMMRAASVGVRDTVYFYYPEVPEGTILGGSNPNAILHYALPLARALCDSAIETTGGKMRCHFVDMVPVFEGKSGVFAPGDIHPNSAGSALMAAAIWDAMTAACVGQKESSGCCEP